MSYAQTIYNVLRQCGLSQDGSLAVLGNFDCESNCEPFRLEGDYNSYRKLSKQYVADVTSGKISRKQFATDSKGFGLAQWTYYSRKYALYDYWKSSGRALDDVVMQTMFAMTELQTDFYSLLRNLQVSNNLYESTDRFCREFENPAVKNVSARYESAKRLKGEIDLAGGEVPSGEVPKPKSGLILRTIDRRCKDFPEIYLLQSVLLCRGYDLAVDGKWSENLTVAVEGFQMEAFPNQPAEWDCVVGNKTWTKLFER